MTERQALKECIRSYYNRGQATDYLSRIFNKYSRFNIQDIFVRQGIHFPLSLPTVQHEVSPERRKFLQDLSLQER